MKPETTLDDFTTAELLGEYRAAYRAAHPHREVPMVTHRYGWFTVMGSYKYRRRQFLENIKRLKGILHV